jgi:hypothetical protein
MAEIDVNEQRPGCFAVEVHDGSQTTRHEITVPDGMTDWFGGSSPDPVALVRESFAFLLQRESPTSILRRFRLDVIGEYFPEYRSEIVRRMTGGTVDPSSGTG